MFPSLLTAKGLAVNDQVKYANGMSLFLLHGDPNEGEEMRIIYVAKSYLAALKDLEGWLLGAAFSSCPKAPDQLETGHARAEPCSGTNFSLVFGLGKEAARIEKAQIGTT
ncbi:hypothetical protein DSO57_1033973 [Entomophthora muscae]|uniref:Uncharacterized protein n=1 Tax=Entomophthora muscae TaxID=34485 RepID=A0ACC2RQT8_9FUNG|nr:hypothetical protein DSO57_1033973 [Entomophthora muscae]